MGERTRRIKRMKKAKIQTIVFKLPSYWASYLINDDATGLEDGEQEEIDSWVERQRFVGNYQLFSCANCSEESFFAWHNDANSIGGDCLDYTFLVE